MKPRPLDELLNFRLLQGRMRKQSGLFGLDAGCLDDLAPLLRLDLLELASPSGVVVKGSVPLASKKALAAGLLCRR